VKQSSSDPLPYVQVDRAVEPTAALLAGHMKVTNQHAIGSLVGFWKLCGDPRELERIVQSTAPGKEPEVLLSAEDVALRFQLAADHRVEPVVLARLGILEERAPNVFRVRGMSRFFDPIVRRLVKRSIGKVGGKASAEARKAAVGSAQPVAASFDAGSGSGSDGASAVVKQARSNAEATPKQDRSTEQHSGQRSAVSGQRSPQEEEATPPQEPVVAAFDIKPPNIDTIDSWAKEDFWKAAEITRRDAGFPPERWPNPVALSRWWGEAQQAADTRTLADAFVSFTQDKHWRAASPPCPWAAFAKQYLNFLPSQGAA
jgi:hypothetical protein